MIYVLSDIHGQQQRFESILEIINLQPEDMLYILGDVIDRNPDGIRILRRIMAMPNARMILGNHELMMLDALYYPVEEPEPQWDDYHHHRRLSLWYRNGGDITHRYLKHIRKSLRLEIFEYLDSLPYNREVEINGRRFVLTHAAPASLYGRYGRKYRDEREFSVWKRFDTFPKIDGQTVIFGHTPTYHYNFESPMEIWNAGNWIGIDCGCMFPKDGDPWSGVQGRLACLRLDDMQVFYSVD